MHRVVSDSNLGVHLFWLQTILGNHFAPYRVFGCARKIVLRFYFHFKLFLDSDVEREREREREREPSTSRNQTCRRDHAPTRDALARSRHRLRTAKIVLPRSRHMKPATA